MSTAKLEAVTNLLEKLQSDLTKVCLLPHREQHLWTLLVSTTNSSQSETLLLKSSKYMDVTLKTPNLSSLNRYTLYSNDT